LDPDLDPPPAFFFFSPGAAFFFGSLEPAMIVAGSDTTCSLSLSHDFSLDEKDRDSSVLPAFNIAAFLPFFTPFIHSNK
jgi:hypothetical protein